MGFKRAISFDCEWSTQTEELVCVQYCEIDLRKMRRGVGRVLHARDPQTGTIVRGWLKDSETLLVGLWTHVDTWAIANRWGLWRQVEEAYKARRIGDVATREKLVHLARPGEIKIAYLGEAVTGEDQPDDDYDDGGQRKGRKMIKVVRKYCGQRGTGAPMLIPKRGLPVGMGPTAKRRLGLDMSEDKHVSVTLKKAQSELRKFLVDDVPTLSLSKGFPSQAAAGARIWDILGSKEGRKDARDLCKARRKALGLKGVTPREPSDLLEVEPGLALTVAQEGGFAACLSAYLYSAQPCRMRYHDVLGLPVKDWPEGFEDYARRDTEITADLWIDQWREPRDKWTHSKSVSWWGKVAPTPLEAREGIKVHFSHEALRSHYAYHLQRCAQGGIRVDREYARNLRGDYNRVRDAAARVMCRHGVAGERPKRKPHETWYQTYAGASQSRPSANNLHDMALACYGDRRDVEPGLTDKGRQVAAEWEGRPLKEWPEDVKAYLSTAGHHLRRAVTPQSEDAKTLVKEGAIAALEWQPDRIEAALEECDYPGLLAYTVLTKSHAYAGGMLGPLCDGAGDIVRPRFQPLLDTGRISLAGDIRQNMPQAGGIRECFIPRDGCAFVIADYSQIELLAFALLIDWAQGYPGPLSIALNEGRDAHIVLAQDFLAVEGLDLTYEEMISLKAGKGDPALVARVLKKRKNAKPINYGYGANMSEATFCRTQAKAGNILTLEEARLGKRIWLNRWMPQAYFDKIQSLQEHFAKGLGRGVHLGISTSIPFPSCLAEDALVRGGLTYTQAANTFFQSICAIGFARAFIAVSQAGDDRKSPLYGFRPRLPIHDEIVNEGPAHRAEEALVEQERIMRREMGAVLKGVAVATEGAILTERWAKI